MRARIMSLGVAGVTAAGLLAGCGGEEEPAAAPPGAVAPSSPEGAPGQGDPAAGAGAIKVTKPGTVLKVGQQAVVPLKNIAAGSTPGTVGITVTAIEPVDRATFEQMISSRDRNKGLDPYYIRYTVENVGGTDLAQGLTPVLNVVGPGNAPITEKVVLMSEVACDKRRLDTTFAEAGAKLETCRLRVSRKGTPVTGARYDHREGGYTDNPIIWNR